MQVIIDTLLVNYHSSGQGQLVLLLHGWGDNSKGLADLQRRLAADYLVIAVDLPGFGDSQAPKGVWDLDDYGVFVKHFLKKIKAPQTYAVIGHSNGGALAIRAISKGQLKPQKLILIAASGIRTGTSLKRQALKVISKIGKVASSPLPKRHQRKLRAKLYQKAGSDMLVVPELQETFKKTVRQDVQQDAAVLNLPTLLLYADADQAVPLADGHTYHRLIKDSQLVIVSGTSHFLHLDEPEAVTEQIKAFLT